ncbi:malic enzyme-like NAD(P)-binding protein [Pseudomonas plecoglossicida]|uniref:malic enzyme-like NAD(P)-binding protein n=1 Tax=Pseudomonas plecoglossicida TaxID=70775 RepID=UPI003D24AA65
MPKLPLYHKVLERYPPTSQIEANPADLLQWTEGHALIATGSPFQPVEWAGRPYKIAQCNNSYIFPGIGLGVIVSQATRVTERMLMASARALAQSAKPGEMLPAMAEVQAVSKSIALAVALAAQADGVAAEQDERTLREAIEAYFWTPCYRSYQPA